MSDATWGTRRIWSDLDVAGGDFVEVFRARNLGGDYRLTVELQSL